MNCEPIYELPQRIDIAELRRSMETFRSQATSQQTIEKDTHDKQTKAVADSGYDILPLQHNETVIDLRSIVSLQANEYLRCRWNYFLQQGDAAGYPRIRLYSELHKIKTKPKRMQMNGQFYGVTNKLSPVPVVEEARGGPSKINKPAQGKCKSKSK